MRWNPILDPSLFLIIYIAKQKKHLVDQFSRARLGWWKAAFLLRWFYWVFTFSWAPHLSIVFAVQWLQSALRERLGRYWYGSIVMLIVDTSHCTIDGELTLMAAEELLMDGCDEWSGIYSQLSNITELQMRGGCNFARQSPQYCLLLL